MDKEKEYEQSQLKKRKKWREQRLVNSSKNPDSANEEEEIEWRKKEFEDGRKNYYIQLKIQQQQENLENNSKKRRIETKKIN